MKLIAPAALVACTLLPQPAFANDGIRGGTASGINGHYFERGHAVDGAAVGCASSRHHYALQARSLKAAAKAGV